MKIYKNRDFNEHSALLCLQVTLPFESGCLELKKNILINECSPTQMNSESYDMSWYTFNTEFSELEMWAKYFYYFYFYVGISNIMLRIVYVWLKGVTALHIGAKSTSEALWYFSFFHPCVISRFWKKEINLENDMKFREI